MSKSKKQTVILAGLPFEVDVRPGRGTMYVHRFGNGMKIEHWVSEYKYNTGSWIALYKTSRKLSEAHCPSPAQFSATIKDLKEIAKTRAEAEMKFQQDILDSLK